jgi:hypothetical protein
MRLRRKRTGITPGHRGRFDGFDVMSQSSSWDLVTEGAVLSRLLPPPPDRFFTAQEETTCRCLLDRLLAQDQEPRIPLFEPIDARLARAEGEGWRHEDMPEDGEAWRRSLAALEAWASDGFGGSFSELDRPEQNRLVETARTAQRVGDLPGRWVWNLWMRYALAAFYSHPWAWNEIGFGGPAYPRGYKNLGLDGRENWERRERDARDPVRWSDRLDDARRGR